MQNYLDLLQDIMDNGFDKESRTGIDTRSVWGRCLRWDLSEGFPIITTRRVAFRIAFEETMFFLRGERQTTELEDKNINIWKGNTTREFLDARGLDWLDEGDMGYGYGHQWRNFGGYDAKDSPEDWHYTGVDQVTTMLDDMKKDPFSRRHLITAWNPQQLYGMALPPCHIIHHYQVTPNGKLNSAFLMRSNDVPFGLPYNIMGYALLNHLFAAYLGYEPGDLVYMGTDAHIYHNQFDMVEEQLKREPRSLPRLNILKEINSLDSMFNLEYNDVSLEGYDPFPDIKNKPGMAV
jgi:thymidylate synthase